MVGRWLLLAVLTTSYGAGAFGMLGISPLSPSLVEGFALPRLQVALIVPSIYLGDSSSRCRRAYDREREPS